MKQFLQLLHVDSASVPSHDVRVSGPQLLLTSLFGILVLLLFVV